MSLWPSLRKTEYLKTISMETLFATTGIILSLVILILHTQNVKLKEEIDSTNDELKHCLEAIKRAEETDRVCFSRPKNEFVRLLFNEYVKLHLQQSLERRIRVKSQNIITDKTVNHG